MKKIVARDFFVLLVVLFFSPFRLTAQVPRMFSYQAVVRGDDGGVLKSASLQVRLSLLQGSDAGTAVWSETHSVTTNAQGLFTVEAGSEEPLTVDWSAGPWWLKVEVDLNDGNGFREMGASRILSVPYALQASDVGTLSRLEVQGQTLDSDSVLFEVRRKDGQPVFVVYNDGVRIYVNDTADTKGPRRSGFAIGGYGMTKGEAAEYFRVTPDSTRVYVREPSSKGPKRGGFAIGGLDFNKGPVKEYFNVSSTADVETVSPSRPRLLWYPRKEAFLAGRVLVESPDSVGTNAMATGFESKAIGDYSQALGYQARAEGNNATAIGNHAAAKGAGSYAVGNYAMTLDSGSYAIGSGALAKGLRSFAIGSVGVDSAGYATAPTQALGDYSYAFGMGSVASGLGAFAMGTQDTASGKFSLSMGSNTNALGDYSIAIGRWSDVGGKFSIGIGRKISASGDYSTAIGRWAYAKGLSAVAIGLFTIASGDISTSIGDNTKATGLVSTALGGFTTASGGYATAMGYKTTASGTSSTAIGSNTVASGSYSLAMGSGTTASGTTSTAMGFQTNSKGGFSTAMGYGTTAESYASTAMGYQTTASENYSTAIGYQTNAKGEYSTAMGYKTTASGTSSTAIGSNTVASGGYSIAMGALATAEGDYSTAMGFHTRAKSYLSMAIGRYNLDNGYDWWWYDEDPLFTIGNGTSDTTRHNAVLVKKNGEVYFPDVYEDGLTGSYRDLYIGSDGKIGYVSSSRRYKENIRDMEDVSWLYRLRPVNFVYKKDPSHTLQYGLIAEEVEKVNPQLVSYDAQGRPETVTYGMLVIPLLKALQEQQQKIERQQQEIEQLKKENSQLTSLRERLEQLEKIVGTMASITPVTEKE